jgi:hypothetical protein
MRMIILSVFFALIVVGCSSSDQLERLIESSDADHIGKIMKIDQTANKILVKERRNIDDHSPIWLSITAETEMFNAKGKQISFTELKKGSLLEAWNEGGVFLSDPRLATAKKVIILPKN